jgi:hypothetical protein
VSERALDAVWRVLLVATGGALAVTAGLALAGWRFAAWLMVAAAGVGVVANVALSVAKYRRTMRRAWPAVAPVPDDDW